MTETRTMTRRRLAAELTYASQVRHDQCRRVKAILEALIGRVEAIQCGEVDGPDRLEQCCTRLAYDGMTVCIPVDTLLGAERERQELNRMLLTLDGAEVEA